MTEAIATFRILLYNKQQNFTEKLKIDSGGYNMVSVHEKGAYLVNGTEIITDGPEALIQVKSKTGKEISILQHGLWASTSLRDGVSVKDPHLHANQGFPD